METEDKYIIISKLRYMNKHYLNGKPRVMTGALSLDSAKAYMKIRSINTEEYCIVKIGSRVPYD